MHRFAFLAAGIVTGIAGAANAVQTVLMDFGDNLSYRGVSVPSPDLNGNKWNEIHTGAYFPNLIDTTGTATSLAFGFSNGVATDSYNGPAGATSSPHPTPAEIAATDIDAAALGILGVKEAAIDFVASDPGTNVKFEIQGLDPSKTYDLKLFGSHKYGSTTTLYTIYSDNTYTTPVASTTLLVNPDGAGSHNRDLVATLNNVAPQTFNILYVQFNDVAGSGQGYLNSLAISEHVVPEPASLGALAIAGIFAVRRRRA